MEEQQALEVLAEVTRDMEEVARMTTEAEGERAKALRSLLTSVQEIGCVLLPHVMHIITPFV